MFCIFCRKLVEVPGCLDRFSYCPLVLCIFWDSSKIRQQENSWWRERKATGFGEDRKNNLCFNRRTCSNRECTSTARSRSGKGSNCVITTPMHVISNKPLEGLSVEGPYGKGRGTTCTRGIPLPGGCPQVNTFEQVKVVAMGTPLWTEWQTNTTKNNTFSCNFGKWMFFLVSQDISQPTETLYSYDQPDDRHTSASVELTGTGYM